MGSPGASGGASLRKLVNVIYGGLIEDGKHRCADGGCQALPIRAFDIGDNT